MRCCLFRKKRSILIVFWTIINNYTCPNGRGRGGGQLRAELLRNFMKKKYKKKFEIFLGTESEPVIDIFVWPQRCGTLWFFKNFFGQNLQSISIPFGFVKSIKINKIYASKIFQVKFLCKIQTYLGEMALAVPIAKENFENFSRIFYWKFEKQNFSQIFGWSEKIYQ